VVYLILSAGFKMLKKMKRTPFNLTIISAVTLCMVVFSIFAVKFSTVFYILICGFVGFLIYLLGLIRGREGNR
jgi:chromate transporter